MDFKDIKRIVELMEQYGLSAFTLEQDQTKLELKRGGDLDIKAIQNLLASSHPPQYAMPYPVGPSASAVSAPGAAATKEEVAPATNLKEITSPMVGTFYSASSPDAPAFVKIGSKVTADSTVCIIEAMKVMNEIKADIAGEIVEVLVENGSAVQYGEPLYRVKVS